MKKLIKERLNGLVEAGEESKREDTPSYDNLKQALDNDLINHAAVMRRLWGTEDQDTNRSEFRKKLNQSTSDSGGKYSFSEEEVGKIESILLTLSKDINSTIDKRKKRGED